MSWGKVVEAGVSIPIGIEFAKWGLENISYNPLAGGAALILGGILIVVNVVIGGSGALEIWTKTYIKAKAAAK